jgi:lysophospholipase L1-like esterase
LLKWVGGEYNYSMNPQYDAYVSMFSNSKIGDAEIAFVGDSITLGGRFEEFFPDKGTVINRGIGSDTAEGIYHRINEVLSHHPGKIFINIGINDLGRNVPGDDTMLYLKKTIDAILSGSRKDCKIYIISVFPAANVPDEKVEVLNASYQKICNEYEAVTYIDLHDLFEEDGAIITELYSTDGVHLNGNGYAVWIEGIEKYIDE